MVSRGLEGADFDDDASESEWMLFDDDDDESGDACRPPAVVLRDFDEMENVRVTFLVNDVESSLVEGVDG